ncbi:hypothetical protein HYH03_001409 [Edaphochlamys debaryana]|uniref:L-2-hydroxyglutarate dehydrogenase, mitochondrial n=1 Tax=Edaphochlamys debaryana TaxID=47281 RepID=A0A835YCX1_9CHLO|nr:hypothetical protein HYH03_001409 [Edaphochlamys debaryana]|eukprot:KAG2500642.1 hypothetical protein HYH03_001409 [Edaphochlamys debaryana]
MRRDADVDCVVIGAGVIGLAAARALALRGREVVVVEAAGAVGTETSSRHSEVIHAGIYYPEGSLKARLCVEGKARLYDFCRTHNVPYKRITKLIVATSKDQLPDLSAFRARAARHGVADLQPLSGPQAQELEPALAAQGALLSPSTGIIDSHTYMAALLADAEAHGAVLALHTRVTAVRTQHAPHALASSPSSASTSARSPASASTSTPAASDPDPAPAQAPARSSQSVSYKLLDLETHTPPPEGEGSGAGTPTSASLPVPGPGLGTSPDSGSGPAAESCSRSGSGSGQVERSTLRARWVVNAAGLHAQRLAAAVQGLPRSSIPPLYLAKGNYFSLAGRCPFSRLVYPLPERGLAGLGTHLTLDLAGAGRFGPDVEWLPEPGPDPAAHVRMDYRVDPRRADVFYPAIRRYFPGLSDGALQPAYSGCRPKLSGPGQPAADFLIQGSAAHGLRGWVNLYGIESPGLTSSLAIAEHVAGLLESDEGR